MIRFEKTLTPCVADEVTAWHAVHGWLWNVVVYENTDQHGPTRTDTIGVFYCTLLCGDGAVVHFDTVGPIAPLHLLAAMKKGIRMIAPYCGVIFATIPEDRAKLIRVAIRLGFGLTDGGYLRDGQKIALLKFFAPRKNYITSKTPTQERTT